MSFQVNRREALFRIGVSIFPFMCKLDAAQGFWNRKDINDWTGDEILQLTTRSPWAVQARVLPNQGKDKGSTHGIEPDVSGGHARNRETGSIPIVAVQEATVVWASARPLVDVLKTHFPPDFANHYVISISNLPLPPGATASLQAKGKESLGAGLIDNIKSGSIFGFTKELLPLSAGDKEAIFSLSSDRYSIRARFDLKEMVYRGELAV
jgi:hypothetical protein